MNEPRLLVVGVLMLGMSAVAGAEDKEAKVEVAKAKLTGTWMGVLPKGKVKGTLTMTLGKDGKLALTIRAKTPGGDKELRHAGTYKIDGDKIELTIKDDEKEKKETLTVTKLTDTELVVKGREGKTIAFKKAKPRRK